MAKNPHTKGSYEYLEFATKQNNAAQAENMKNKMIRESKKAKPRNPVGLAESQIESKQKKTSDFMNEFMTGRSKIKR